MAKINLLPIDLAPNEATLKVKVGLKRATLTLLILTALVVIGTTAYLYISRRYIETLKSDKSEHLEEISALEDTEKELFLTKDRINKIRTVLDEKNLSEEIEEIEIIRSKIAGIASFVDGEVFFDGFDITVAISKSQNLEEFMRILREDEIYQKITMESLSFTGANGYLMSFAFQK